MHTGFFLIQYILADCAYNKYRCAGKASGNSIVLKNRASKYEIYLEAYDYLGFNCL